MQLLAVEPTKRFEHGWADLMKLVESRETRTDIPNFGPGDTIKSMWKGQ